MNNVISFPASRVAEELRVSCTGDQLDLRIYANGAGPAKVMMPTKRGLTFPVAMLPDLIRSLQNAEAKARELGLVGGEP